MNVRARTKVGVVIAAMIAALGVQVATAAAETGGGAQHSLRSPVTDENFYFVMADRFENGSVANDLGGLPSDRMTSGFDPTAKGWYHGGDLAGLRQRLNYIEGLGTTAIWLTPSFKNKPVQSDPNGSSSAGYHGYWVTDFTQIDPHLGTNADLRSLVEAAHARGIKVYFDIITNHTADVIQYREGVWPPYISKDEAPYRTAAGEVFDDRDYAGTNAFPPLDTDVSFPLTPFVPAGSQRMVPDWLNDLTLYHNRGNTTFVGENSLYGDFFGLDDLFTEHPRVVRGMIDVYKTWIGDYGIDGFRIDTMRHVNDEFWQQFGPEVLQYARDQGKSEFFMFGEVADTSKPYTSHFSTKDRMQSVLDFPFQAAAQSYVANSGAAEALADFFADDDWYTDADSNAYQLPTFVGNHDMGRIGRFIQVANPGASDAELVARDRWRTSSCTSRAATPSSTTATSRVSPATAATSSHGRTCFRAGSPSTTTTTSSARTQTTAQANFDRRHPLYRAIAQLAEVTRDHPALRNGSQQQRYASNGPGIFAMSRIDRSEQREYLVALNNSEEEKSATVQTYAQQRRYGRVYGSGRRGAARTPRAGSGSPCRRSRRWSMNPRDGSWRVRRLHPYSLSSPSAAPSRAR